MAIDLLQIQDYIVLIVYTVLMALIGAIYGFVVRESGAYIKGSGAIPWPIVGISNFMTLFSTFMFVAYAGLAYKFGITAVVVFWTMIPACLVGTLLSSRWRRTGASTAMEYLETRFSLPVRQISSWAGMVVRILDNMVRLYALGVFVSAVTPLDTWAAIAVSGLVIVLFTILGGAWSISVMSTVQAVILVIITAAMVPLSLKEVGGLENAMGTIPDHFDPLNGPSGIPWWMFAYTIMIIIKTNSNWAYIQKQYCVRNEAMAVKSTALTCLLFVIFTPIFLFPAVIAPLIIPGIDNPEMSYVMVSAKLLPRGMMGIMFASMFAASMSTLNTELNSMSGVFTVDVYKRLMNRDAADGRLLKVARISTLIFGFAIIVGSLFIIYFGGTFDANKILSSVFAVPLGLPVVIGIISRRPNSTNVIAAIFGGMIFGMVMNSCTNLPWEHVTLMEIALCMILLFVPMPCRGSADKKKDVEEFFKLLKTDIKEESKPALPSKMGKVTRFTLIMSLAIVAILFTVAWLLG